MMRFSDRSEICEPEAAQCNLEALRAAAGGHPDAGSLMRLRVAERTLEKGRFYEIARDLGREVGRSNRAHPQQSVVIVTGSGPGIGTGQSSCQARRSVDRPLQPDDRNVVFYRATAQGSSAAFLLSRAPGIERQVPESGCSPLSGTMVVQDHSARLRPVIIARTRFSLCSMLASTTPATCKPIRPRVRFASSSCVSSTHSTPQ